ncbi:MAG: T9SS type A sorting domain-containing protein, partial [Bacteroidota bacterium]
MKTIFLILFGLVYSQLLCAQISIERQVIGSTGNLINSGTIISFSTIGEVVIPTFIQSTLIATQGFEQPDNSVIGINSNNTPQFNLIVYPNPLTDVLYVKGDELNNGHYEIILIDLLGQQLQKVSIDVINRFIEMKFDTKGLASGIYYLNFR